jgi:catechol 2,3-dioxygenase-like lactoylglutathione lyase family enzyme
MPLSAHPDHVAVAVPSIAAAAARWHEQLGGAWHSPHHSPGGGFATRHLRYRGGAKLELLEPEDDAGFAARFIRRFGARVHHVTLKVPDLLAAVELVRDAGYDVVDVSTDRDDWHEAFLRPSQVGGVIVQLAHSPLTHEEWMARHFGWPTEPLPEVGPALVGPTFHHPDLEASARVWSVLGAEVERSDDEVRIRWRDHPLDVLVRAGSTDDAPSLRFEEAERLASDPQLGPAIMLA